MAHASAELPFDILAAMKDVQNRHVLILDGVDDHVLPDRKTTQSRTKIVAGTAHARVLAQQMKALSDSIDDAVCDGDIAAFYDDVVPDVAKLGLRLGCE
jgi:hypothetical protein